MSDRVPQASLPLVRERARALVAAGGSRVLILRARPKWSGDDELPIAGQRVLIRTAGSQLAALDALSARTGTDFLVLLTDRSDRDLGDAVLVHADRQRVESIDEWSAVPALFGAHRVDPDLRRAGSWVPGALLERAPAAGWPPAPSGVLTADHALGNLLGSVLGLDLPAELDLLTVMTSLDDPLTRAAWQAAPEELRKRLALWAGDGIGDAARVALGAAAGSAVSVTALGLALDVLWPSGAGAEELDPDQAAARGRIEGHLDGRPVSPATARVLGSTARSLVIRLQTLDDPAAGRVLDQTEALLATVRWPAGAERSSVLPAGLTARLRALAALLTSPDPAALVAALPRIEGALRDVVAHDLARGADTGVIAARMAVRLVRWLAVQDTPTADGLGSALMSYLHDGAWVDRAAAQVWEGTHDPEVSAAFRHVWTAVQARRSELDAVAALALAESTARDLPPEGATLIENVLADVVTPWSGPTLVILLDGMSAPVAVQLADAIGTAGWTELVPASSGHRLPVLAALPTLTRYSRTAFFTGELRDGQQDTEKSAMKARFGAQLFHKDDLRAPAGEALPAAVRDAISDPRQRLVAAVLNTIDDALKSHDPGGTRWDLDDVQNLRALLNAAALAGRAVVLTSDHGHVVERGGEVRSTPGAEARWRPSTSAAQAGEVAVRGRRVVTGEVVLAVREDLRYTSLRSGYHGGGSLAEITVPFLVFTRGAAVAGWRPAPPQAPAWWNEVQRAPRPSAPGRRAVTVDPSWATPISRSVMPEAQGMLELTIPERAAPAVASDVVTALSASDVYLAQRERAGRRALAHDRVVDALRALIDRGGKAHRDTWASVLGIPATSVASELAALARILNIEGYPVVGMDDDGVTVALDVALLREQFELGAAHG